MENITTGHWIYAIVAIGIYILFIAWSYKKEQRYLFNFKPLSIIIWCILILFLIIITS